MDISCIIAAIQFGPSSIQFVPVECKLSNRNCNKKRSYVAEYKKKEKHDKDAKHGWYRYDVRFAIPVYENDVLIRYNVFRARLLINHAQNGKKYLYDILTIKKETSKPQQ